MSEAPKDEPIEVEVVRLPAEGESPRPPSRSRWWKALEPVLAGFALDFANYFSVNAAVGLVLGALAGMLVSRKLGLAPRWSIGLTLASALYCAAPGRFLPLGTILGAFGRIDLDALRGR